MFALSNPPHKSDLPYGAFSRIARRLRPKVSANHVREVYYGRRVSARVSRAITVYLRGLQESAQGETAGSAMERAA